MITRLLFSLWLILFGLSIIIGIQLPFQGWILGVLAIVCGVLIILKGDK